MAGIKNMPFDCINQRMYNRKNTVLSYSYSPSDYILQTAEAIIFVKYKDHLWNKRILDIGCGGGRTAIFLRQFSKNYTGIDYSYNMIEQCKKKFRDTRFLECDVRDMGQFDDRSFDFIFFSFNGLDYISHEDRLLALREVYRVLSDKGLFAFSSHNKDYSHLSRSPKLMVSMNLIKQFKLIKEFVIQIKNFSKNKKYQYISEEYAIINVENYDFSFLTYYIGKKTQIHQLKETGFEVTEMYDNKGDVLDYEKDDYDSPWIYYVSEKVS